MTTDNGFPNWLQYLLDVCRPQWRENSLGAEYPRALALLDSFYADDEGRMMIGVKAYLKQKSDAFIPFPGEIEKHLPPLAEKDAPLIPFVLWHKYKVAALWPICPMCEEHTPNVKDCPLCADMKATAARNALDISALAL